MKLICPRPNVFAVNQVFTYIFLSFLTKWVKNTDLKNEHYYLVTLKNLQNTCLCLAIPENQEKSTLYLVICMHAAVQWL